MARVEIFDETGQLLSDVPNRALRVNVVATTGGGGGDGAILDGADPAIKATVFDFANSNPLGVVLRDTNGDYVSVGGGTQYTEDDPSVANPVGTQLIARRRDALVTETTTDGDVTAVNSTARGELYVKHVDAIPVTGTFFQATQPVSATSLPLPTGAATEATLATVLTTAAFQARINTLGQKTMANSTPVVIASDQSALPVTGTFFQATQPISAVALPLPAGAATEATLAGVLTTTAFQARINTLGQKTMANSTPVVLASDQSAISVTGTFFQATQPVSIAATVAVKELRSATGAQTSVAGSASSVTLLASNANRLGASIYNDSTAILYVRFQATASTSNFSVKLFPDDFYEVPFGYTGIIDGIWASATGNARVTEYT